MIEMRFDEMDKKMRVYEQSLDQVLLPDIYMVAIVELWKHDIEAGKL